MKSQRPGRLAVLLIASAALAISCYTLKLPTKKQKDPGMPGASKALQTVIFDYVQDTLYTFPHVATRVGMHVHELPRGEKIDLDRELPNFSDELISARIETLEKYLKKLDRKAPAAALSENDKADRQLLVDAIRLELFQFADLKAHTRNPLVHVVALNEAIYYPLVVEYAPEQDRMADVLGRLHMLPAYVDRTIRMLEHSADPFTDAAVEINKWTIELVRDEMPGRMESDKELQTSFAGMKGPVLEALDKLQKFLEKELPAKSKRSWRIGEERYEELFVMALHGAATPESAQQLATKRIDELRREMFDLVKPVYCEEYEEDRDLCGPTKAEIAAAKKAEDDRLRKEEEQRRKEEEREAKEEERKRKAEEREREKEEKRKAKEEEQQRKEEERQAKEEERQRKAEEKKKAKEEEKKAKEEEKKKGEEDEDEGISNPYETKPKKKEKEDEGISNPYGYYRLVPRDARGAKLADDEEEEAAEEAEAADEDEDAEPAPKAAKAEAVSDATIDKVIGKVLKLLEKEAASGDKLVSRVERLVGEMGELAAERRVLVGADTSGLETQAITPRFAATGQILALVPAPVFQSAQGGHLFVTPGGSRSGLDDVSRDRLRLIVARIAAPGTFEAYRRGALVEPQTRRAVRSLFGCPAFLDGWGLYAASAIGASSKGDDAWQLKLVALGEQLRAAVAVLVDIDLHVGAMKEAEAKELLVQRAFMDSGEAASLVTRAQLAPTAIAAPFIGLHGWLDARGKVKEAQGDEFSAKQFHKRALAGGAVPVGAIAPILTAADPDAIPAYKPEGAEEEEEEEEKSRYSILDAF